ncbi:MAG: trypsin-like peptidase domain-containing protein [Gloeobacteraceae cyanobacterium ES-bin-316]|nr:trypsin-like peptidase domain-containing protein [Ferruginibacter sp.]
MIMEDSKLLETVERYISGQMSPDERVYFESLRKSNAEIDQLVVEHTFFLQQMNRYDRTKKFKSSLNDIHIDLAEKGAIKSTRLQGKAKVIYVFNRYKRTAALAASIAGITALSISILVSSVTPANQKNEIDVLSRAIKNLETKDEQQSREIYNIKYNIKKGSTTPAKITYTTGGTSFLIDAKGYLITNAHVIRNAKHIAVQNSNGKDFTAKVVFTDVPRDLAILKIDDTAFKAPLSIPYSIKKTTAEIAEPIYTLGFPRNDIVYGEGYLAATTGFNGDTLSCQIAIAANPGNSGGPILNRNGEVIGVLSGRQTAAEGVVFATQSKYIHQALSELQEDTTYQRVKLPATSSLKGMDKTHQVQKISPFVYMVKVN